ncbi:DUF4864 domain-containing protein [Parasphingorhabdus sp.]|uniref:DUF4864 domain-containing protein n=1 Tax=Parasphingorhabdus sp. TaxID=2709688 RepID=UPI003003145D
MMKTWMKVVLGIIAAILALVSLIFWLTGDVTKAGDDFFEAVQNDDIDAAYELLSEDFQAGTSKQQLQTYLETNALDNISEVSWGARSIENNMGTLNATVETNSGGTIPLMMRLVNGSNGWKIQSIRKESAGFGAGTTDASLPSRAKQSELEKGTIAAFSASLADRDMTKLYDHSSQLWQQQTSVEELENVFGEFYEYAPGYAAIARLNPVLDDATIDGETQVLTIKSHYPVEPSAVYFENKYIYEGTDWKLMGLNLKIGTSPN